MAVWLMPVRCAARIPELQRAGSPWLSAAGAADAGAGLMWMERPGDFWEVRFRTLALVDDSGDASCPDPAE